MSHDHSHHMHHDHAPPPAVMNLSTSTAMPLSSTTMMSHDHHDHSMHSSGDQMGHAMTHMMEMAFHGGCNETILFSQWTTSSCSGLIWSMVVIFIMGVLYEGLKYYRENLFWKSYNALQYRAVSAPSEKNGNVENDNTRVVHMVGEVVHQNPPTMFSLMHLYQSFLHLVQVTLSLMLMLVFMTYNTYLCIAVVFGAMVGYFLFGWKKSVVVDVTEHCH